VARKLYTLSSSLVVLLLACLAHATVIDPSDSNLLYTGRWQQSNPSAPWAQAKGSSVIARFEGTSIAVTLTTGSSEYYRVIIDGDAASSTESMLPSGVSTTLASGLADAVHEIEIIKERDPGRVTLTELTLDTDKSLVSPPARPPRRIVFYGDSNVAGYSLESERNQGGSNLQGSYYTYAGVTARMFDAEYHNVSLSGATISSLNQRFDRYDWGSNNPGWDFSFDPDVVIVNIGANDVGTPKSTIKTRYHNLLDDLRAEHGTDVPIVLYNAYGWDANEPANYTHEVVSERGDPNLRSHIFPWVFEQFHGCETDHAGMAEYLADHLEAVMGWTANAPDVVSGYGHDGDVANGSFEGVAPFGGWGWRYFDDPGVARVFDPVDAQHGSYFLRLDDGATSHQTNPSSNGEVHEYTFWLRGAFAGDKVNVTIDFRDQDDGAEIATPVVAHTETKVLTTSWAEYTMMATAPTSPPNPIYATRLDFEAASGDTVDVDRVQLVPEPSELISLAAGIALLRLLKRRREAAATRLRSRPTRRGP
jgi:lysophospholipase L1-like esterase